MRMGNGTDVKYEQKETINQSIDNEELIAYEKWKVNLILKHLKHVKIYWINLAK